MDGAGMEVTWIERLHGWSKDRGDVDGEVTWMEQGWR